MEIFMLIFDAHCDTISKISEGGEGLKQNSFHLDLERMNEKHIQIFAAFVDKAAISRSPSAHVCELYKFTKMNLKRTPL